MALEEWEEKLIQYLSEVDRDEDEPWVLNNLPSRKAIRRGRYCPLTAIVKHQTGREIETGQLNIIREILLLTEYQCIQVMMSADDYKKAPAFRAELRSAMLAALRLEENREP